MTHSVKILDRYLIVDEDTGCASLADEAPAPAADTAADVPVDNDRVDADRAPTVCLLTSVSPVSSIDGLCCPIVICDTANPQNAALLCKAAGEKGLCTTVYLTTECAHLPSCDRLLVPEEAYNGYRNAAPEVGVRLAYDVKNPALLPRIKAWVDAGVTLIDAYPTDPRACREGEMQALTEELFRIAEYLYSCRQTGRTVEFLPITQQGKGARHGIGAHRNIRCRTCSHRMLCGGRRLSFADCEIKRTTADCAALLTV